MNQNYRLEMDRLQAHLSDQERMLARQILRNVMRLVSQSRQFMEALGVTLESSNRIRGGDARYGESNVARSDKRRRRYPAPAVQAGGGRR